MSNLAHPAQPGLFPRFLTIPPVDLRWWGVLLLIVAAYAFGVIVRIVWLEGMTNDAFYVDGHLTLTATDGYYWAAGIQNAIDGLHVGNMRIPDWTEHAICALTAAVTQISGEHLLDVMVYMPAFVSSLIVIPIILIGRLLRAPFWGFAAACMAVIGASYYLRTLAGYFDSDMFATNVPMFMLWLMVGAMTHKRIGYTFAASLLMINGGFFYNSVEPVVIALTAGFIGLLVAPVIWRHVILPPKRRQGLPPARDAWVWPHILMVLVALWGIPIPVRIALVAALYVAARTGHLRRVDARFVMWGCAAALVVFLVTSGGIQMITKLMGGYSKRGATTAKGPGEVSFMRVAGLIREAQQIPFEHLVSRWVGSTVMLGLSAVGFVAMLLRYPAMLLSVPLVAIGLFATKGGLRFTVFAVPIFSMAAVYPVFLILRGAARHMGTFVVPVLTGAATVAVVALAYVATGGSGPTREAIAAAAKLGRRLEPGSPIDGGLLLAAGILAAVAAGLAAAVWPKLRDKDGPRALGEMPAWLQVCVAALPIVIAVVICVAMDWRWSAFIPLLIVALLASGVFALSLVRGSSWVRHARTAALVAGGLLLTVPFVYPQVRNAMARSHSTTVTKPEAELMGKLAEVAKPGDYTLSWWDFGYPIWFFGQTNTLIDGGKHGRDNLVISMMLCSTSQLQSVNLARVAVERYHARGRHHKPVIIDLFKSARAAGSTPRAFLSSLAEPGFSPPKATRDIYIYLPHKLLGLMSAVQQFSQSARRDPQNKGPVAKFMFHSPRVRKAPKAPGWLQLSGGSRMNEKDGTVLLRRRNRRGQGATETLKLKALHIVETQPDGSVKRQRRPLNEDGAYHAVFMKSYGSMLIVDKGYLNSTLLRLQVLGNYDKELFELVERAPLGVIYKLKR